MLYHYVPFQAQSKYESKMIQKYCLKSTYFNYELLKEKIVRMIKNCFYVKINERANQPH